MKRAIIIGVAIIGSLISFNSIAQPQMTPEQMAGMSTANRQAVFKLLGFNMAPLGGMARGGEFNQEVALKSLERIQMLSTMIPEVFAMDTTAYDVETRALNKIWGDMDGFAAKANALSMGASEAIEIINTQGASGIRAAMQKVGPTCGSCHDDFRAE